MLQKQRDQVGNQHNKRHAHGEEQHGIAESPCERLTADDLHIVFQPHKLRRAHAAAQKGVPQNEDKRDDVEKHAPRHQRRNQDISVVGFAHKQPSLPHFGKVSFYSLSICFSVP